MELKRRKGKRRNSPRRVPSGKRRYSKKGCWEETRLEKKKRGISGRRGAGKRSFRGLSLLLSKKKEYKRKGSKFGEGPLDRPSDIRVTPRRESEVASSQTFNFGSLTDDENQYQNND